MSRWTTAFVVVGLVVAMLGLGGALVMSVGIGLTLITIFLSAFGTSLVTLMLALRSELRRRSPEQHSARQGALRGGTRSPLD